MVAMSTIFRPSADHISELARAGRPWRTVRTEQGRSANFTLTEAQADEVQAGRSSLLLLDFATASTVLDASRPQLDVYSEPERDLISATSAALRRGEPMTTPTLTVHQVNEAVVRTLTNPHPRSFQNLTADYGSDAPQVYGLLKAGLPTIPVVCPNHTELHSFAYREMLPNEYRRLSIPSFQSMLDFFGPDHRHFLVTNRELRQAYDAPHRVTAWRPEALPTNPILGARIHA